MGGESFPFVKGTFLLEGVTVKLFDRLETLLVGLTILSKINLDVAARKEANAFCFQFEGDLNSVHDPIVGCGLKDYCVGEIFRAEATE